MFEQSDEGKIAQRFLDNAFTNRGYPPHLIIELANIIQQAKAKTWVDVKVKPLPTGEDKRTTIGKVIRPETGSIDANNFMVGQRVLLGQGCRQEIGKVVRPETRSISFGVWVYSPTKGYASDYALSSVRPLPDGQL